MSQPCENAPYVHLINKKGTTDYLLFIIVPVQKNVTCNFPSQLPLFSGGEYLFRITANSSGGTEIIYTQVKNYFFSNSTTTARVKVLASIQGIEQYSNLVLQHANSIDVTNAEWEILKNSMISYNMPYLYLKHIGKTADGYKRMSSRLLIPLLGYKNLKEDFTGDATTEEYIWNLDVEKVAGAPLKWYIPPMADAFEFNAAEDAADDIATFEETVTEVSGTPTNPVKTPKAKVKGKSKNHVDNPYGPEFSYLQGLDTIQGILDKPLPSGLKVKREKGHVHITLDLHTNQESELLLENVAKVIRGLAIEGLKALDAKKK